MIRLVPAANYKIITEERVGAFDVQLYLTDDNTPVYRILLNGQKVLCMTKADERTYPKRAAKRGNDLVMNYQTEMNNSRVIDNLGSESKRTRSQGTDHCSDREGAKRKFKYDVTQDGNVVVHNGRILSFDCALDLFRYVRENSLTQVREISKQQKADIEQALAITSPRLRYLHNLSDQTKLEFAGDMILESVQRYLILSQLGVIEDYREEFRGRNINWGENALYGSGAAWHSDRKLDDPVSEEDYLRIHTTDKRIN